MNSSRPRLKVQAGSNPASACRLITGGVGFHPRLHLHPTAPPMQGCARFGTRRVARRRSARCCFGADHSATSGTPSPVCVKSHTSFANPVRRLRTMNLSMRSNRNMRAGMFNTLCSLRAKPWSMPVPEAVSRGLLSLCANIVTPDELEPTRYCSTRFAT